MHFYISLKSLLHRPVCSYCPGMTLPLEYADVLRACRPLLTEDWPCLHKRTVDLLHTVTVCSHRAGTRFLFAFLSAFLKAASVDFFYFWSCASPDCPSPSYGLSGCGGPVLVGTLRNEWTTCREHLEGIVSPLTTMSIYIETSFSPPVLHVVCLSLCFLHLFSFFLLFTTGHK